MASRIATLSFGLLCLLTVAAGVVRVAWLEEQELFLRERATLAELARQPDATAESVRLGRARLRAEQWVDVELCATDGMLPARWSGAIAVVLWRPRVPELMVRTELSEGVLAQVRRNSRHGCLRIGSGRIEHEDDYAVEALWERFPSQVAEVPLTLSIQARRELDTVDRALVGFGWLSALGLVLGLTVARAGERRARPCAAARDTAANGAPRDEAALDARALVGRGPALPDWARIPVGLVLLTAAYLLSGLLPSGAAVALGAAVGLALVEVGVALGLAPGAGLGAKLEVLGLGAPRRAWAWLPAALVAGVGLRFIAQYALRLVPATGESAVQAFVSWPSGLLSFACLAVLVPLAEEVFFRGLVFGVVERRSRGLAFAMAGSLFVLAHLPQTWGQWGALVSLACTGFALSGLRWASRSTLVSATAHLVFNGTLALGAVFG